MSDQKINFSRPEDIYTDTSNVFYRLRLMVATAIVINESKEADFANVFLRQDGLLYQLESIYEVVKEYEDIFNEAAADCLKVDSASVEA